MIWFALLACLFVSFLFSGIESGVLSVNRVRLRHYARQGEEAAQKLDHLLLGLERLMITVVLITNGANILAVTLLYALFTKWLGAFGAIAALVVALPIFIVGLEFLPKAIFRRFPYRTLVVFAHILTTAHWLFAPVVNFTAWLLRPIFHASRESESGRIVAVEDLQRVLGQNAGQGHFGDAERMLMKHIVDFRPLRAGDLMLPAGPRAESAARDRGSGSAARGREFRRGAISRPGRGGRGERSRAGVRPAARQRQRRPGAILRAAGRRRALRGAGSGDASQAARGAPADGRGAR